MTWGFVVWCCILAAGLQTCRNPGRNVGPCFYWRYIPGLKGVSHPSFRSCKVFPQGWRWLLVLCGSQSVLLSDFRSVCHHWSICVCQHAGHKLLDVHSEHVPGNAECPEQVGGQLAQKAPQCRSPSGPGCAAAKGKAIFGCILVSYQDFEYFLCLISTGDNLSRQNGWDIISSHSSRTR